MGADVIVYYITGKQLGPISVPQSWCEECDLTIRAVRSALEEVDPAGRIRLDVKPWMRHALPALLAGGWHPPVVLIEGSVFSQGVVPDREALRERLTQLAEARRAVSASRARP